MIAVAITMGLLGMAIGCAATHLATRKNTVSLTKENRRLKWDASGAEAQVEFLTSQNQLRDEKVALLREQRDDYARIAETHEIKLPPFQKGRTINRVWKERHYADHPEKNLKDLKEDLSPFDDKQLLLVLNLEFLGGWKRIIRRRHAQEIEAESEGPVDIEEPVRLRRGFLFEGPPSRVLSQIEAFFLDDDHGFVVVEDDEKTWADKDSPMRWQIALSVIEDEAQQPDIEFVEVLRIQKEIQERIVERSVICDVPSEVTDLLSGYTEGEVVSFVEAVLEASELPKSKRLEAELTALERRCEEEDAVSVEKG